MAVAESFTNEVAGRLSELSGEKPTVSEDELAEALTESAGAEVDRDELAEALDELATVSVAVQVGQSAERGRMWRHSGLSEDEARQLVEEARETERREAEEREERERESIAAEEAGAGEDDVTEPGAEPAAAPARRARPATETEPQRIELPMAVAGALDEAAVGKLVTAGLAAADEGGVGFELVVKPRP